MHLYGDFLALLSKLISISDIAGNYILYLDIQTSTKLNIKWKGKKQGVSRNFFYLFIYFFFIKILFYYSIGRRKKCKTRNFVKQFFYEH